MKKIVFILLLCCMLFNASAKSVTVFYEDFSDGNYNQSPSWRLDLGGNVNIINKELNHDGMIVDGSGRYWSVLNSFTNISSTDKISLSYKGLLKKVGSPQEGKGILLSLVGESGERYDFKIQDGYTSSFPTNQHSLSIGYGTSSGIGDYITTNFAPNKDQYYVIKAIRENKIWSLYVDNKFIGEHLDNLNITKFIFVHLPMVGSIVIDDINITIDDGLPEEPETKEETTLERYAPVFYMHPREGYTPVEVSALTENSDLKDENGIMKQSASHLEDVPNFENSDKSYFDLTSVDIETYHAIADNDLFKDYKPTVYGTETIDNLGYKHLQYFVFYPFQNWYIMNHEGDWELVQVTVNPADQVESVQYFTNFLRLIYYDMNKITFVNVTHPVVLVSLGNHNNYADTEEIDLSEDYEFFKKFLYDLKGLDVVSKDGTTFEPVRIADGGIPYDIVEITGDSPIVKFKGKWGQETTYALKDGPRGPKYNSRFFTAWRYPERHSYAPEIPFLSFLIYSPVDARVESDGQAIDFGSEDVLLYTGADEEPKAGVITGHENYTLYLDCKEPEKFTLKLYYYDNDSDSGISATYKNITCTSSGKGRVDASKDSYFALYMDNDGDGRYDNISLPEDVVTYNKTFSIPDTDGDTVADMMDNCHDVKNKDQLDTDKDSLGDACDEDDDNDGTFDTVDACALDYGTYCNGCNMPGCSGCAISSCPLDGIPVCASGECDAITCPADGCHLDGCSNKDYANFPVSVDNTCILDGNNGLCTENTCTPSCKYSAACDTDADNDTIKEEIDNCPGIYNPDQKDYNKDKKGDACDNPRYYKERALDAVKEAQKKSQKEKMTLKLAQKEIEESLDKRMWNGSFVVVDNDVFNDEFMAVEHLKDYRHIAKDLSKADSEIVEYLLLNNKRCRYYALGKGFYDTADFFAERGNFAMSILFYREAWHILNKKA